MLTPMERQSKAISFAKENLRQLATEILDWKNTGLLCKGTGGLLREMAEILDDDDYGLRRAETIVSDLCLSVVSTMTE